MWPIATNAASAGISRVSLASVVLCVAQAQAERDAGPNGVRTRAAKTARACATAAAAVAACLDDDAGEHAALVPLELGDGRVPVHCDLRVREDRLSGAT